MSNSFEKDILTDLEDKLIEQVEALECELISTQWQPIETAPKDARTNILLYDNSPSGKRVMIGRFIGGKWVEPWQHDVLVFCDFSHWMPLPLPPSKENT